MVRHFDLNPAGIMYRELLAGNEKVPMGHCGSGLALFGAKFMFPSDSMRSLKNLP